MLKTTLFCSILLLSRISCFTFSSASVTPSDYYVNSVTTYSVTLIRETDDQLNPTPWNSSYIPSSSVTTITFPSQFNNAQLSSFTCMSIMVNLNPVVGYTCSLSGTTITVSNLFSGNVYVSQVDLSLGGIANPSSAVTTDAFIGTIGTDTSNNSPSADVTFQPANLASLTLSFKGGIVNRTSDMIVNLKTSNPIQSNGIITIQFPATLLWAR